MPGPPRQRRDPGISFRLLSKDGRVKRGHDDGVR